VEALAYGKDLEKDIKVVRAKRAVTDMTLKLSKLKQTVKEAHTIANDMQTKKNEANQKKRDVQFLFLDREQLQVKRQKRIVDKLQQVQCSTSSF
jgi:hypothetical protein